MLLRRPEQRVLARFHGLPAVACDVDEPLGCLGIAALRHGLDDRLVQLIAARATIELSEVLRGRRPTLLSEPEDAIRAKVVRHPFILDEPAEHLRGARVTLL